MIESLKEVVDSILRVQEINTLRVVKLEAEVMVLKTMVFEDLAQQPDADYDEIESKHQKLTHIALLKVFNAIRIGAPHLSEEDITDHLGLNDW